MWEEQRKLAINLYIQGKKQTLCKLTEIFSVDKSKICWLVKNIMETPFWWNQLTKSKKDPHCVRRHQLLEKSIFFCRNSDNYMYIKWKSITCMENSGWSTPTIVCWTIWPQCEDKCYIWGCGNTSANI